MKKIHVFLGIALVFLTACSKFKDEPYNERIEGSWINTFIDGQFVPTNQVFTMRFTKEGAQYYSAGYQLDGNNRTWLDGTLFSYKVVNNDLFIEGSNVYGDFYEMVFTLAHSNDEKLEYTVSSFKVNGTEYPDNKTYTCKKISSDLHDSFVGTWYGRSTTPGTLDTAYHYWDYFADGSYDYYYRDSLGNWVNKPDNEGKYYLYGDFLATNYTNDLITGETGLAYECWNIEINGNTMNWRAIRDNWFEPSYSMVKVSGPPASTKN